MARFTFFKLVTNLIRSHGLGKRNPKSLHSFFSLFHTRLLLLHTHFILPSQYRIRHWEGALMNRYAQEYLRFEMDSSKY